MHYLGELLKIVHPFMPFLTEELYHLMAERADKDGIIVAEWPKETSFDSSVIDRFAQAAEAVSQVRNIRNQKNLSPKEKLELQIKGAADAQYDAVIVKLGNVNLSFTDAKPEGAMSFLIKSTEYFVPLAGSVDPAAEKERLTKDLIYNQGFLKSVQSKLANERFVANAKAEILENERRKEADTLAKIKSIEEQLTQL
jgi:valyl-tRNA synthetase